MSDVGNEVSYNVALGSEVFDPIDAKPVRRRELPGRTADAADPNDTRLVQFVRALTGPDLERVKADYGLALTAYVPNLAYVERVDAATRRRLARDPLVRAVAPYRPEYKVDALVAQRIADGTLGNEPIVASLFSGGSIPLVSDALARAGATDITDSDHRGIGGLARVMFRTEDPAVIDKACHVPDIRFLELAPSIKHDDVSAASMIQSGDTSNATVWAKGIHGEGQIVGQMEGDTLNVAHDFFADAAPNAPGPAHRKVVAIAAGSGADDPTLPDCSRYHATFAAGCAIGDDRNNLGGHANRGTAWAAKLAAAPVSLAAGSTLAGLTANMTAGARVHTNSWHDGRQGNGVPAPYNSIAIDVDTFCYNNEENIVLGSSGNVGEEQGAPGTAKNALCVSAASTNGNNVDDGNPGPTADGRRKPDIVASGCDITSSVDTGSRVLNCGCATSWATPHAAGAAALVRQYFMEGWWAGGTKTPANAITPSGALLRAMLVNSAINMSGPANYPNDNEGWGTIRIDRALMFNDNGRNLVVRDIRNQFGLNTGEDFNQGYTVSGGTSQQLRVVLAYTDPPGTAGAANTLVNNLNLEVTDPNGVVYRGNDFDAAAGLARPNSTSTGDAVNNLEVVLVSAPRPGAWQITLRATSVAVGRQGFAIAITSTARPPSSSGCFVATAVYGDPWHPDVVAIRRWRDDTHTAGGMRGAAMGAFASMYGVTGPVAARAVSHTPRLRRWLASAVFPAFARRVERRTPCVGCRSDEEPPWP